MSSEEINDFIHKLDLPADEVRIEVPDVLKVTGGKLIPYIGWFWRTVDFDQPIRLGDCGHFIGFMEQNKWDYPMWSANDEQNTEICRRLSMMVLGRRTGLMSVSELNDNLNDFANYLQTCAPDY